MTGPSFWMVPIVTCLPLCPKVIDDPSLRPDPGNSGPFPVIGVEYTAIDSGRFGCMNQRRSITVMPSYSTAP
jgi:hypothetical protein